MSQPQASVAVAPRASVPQTGLRLFRDQRFALLLIIVALFVGFGAANPLFFNARFVVAPMLQSAALFTVIGLAQMSVLAVGQMNLAVGRMAAFGALAAGATFQFWNFPLWAGALVGIAAGALIGLLTGWVIVATRVNAFIVTFAMDFTLLGVISLAYAEMTGSTAFSAVPDGLNELGANSFADVCVAGYCGSPAIPFLVLPALVTAIVMFVVFARLRVGREILATGANYRASEMSGIAARRRVLVAHTFSGGLAAVGGIMLAAMNGSFSATIGADFLLPSFLGPVLGGTLLAGGVVSVLGTVLGTVLTLVLRQGLSVQGADVSSLNMALGVVLLIALSTQRLQRMQRRASRVGSKK